MIPRGRLNMLWILFVGTMAACSALSAEDWKIVIVVGGGTDIVEVIDPASLERLGRIHFKFRDGSVGINGVFVDSDGSRVYVEGPIPSEPHGCCSLYSTDIVTLQTSTVA